MAVLETGDLIVYGALKKYVDEHGGGGGLTSAVFEIDNDTGHLFAYTVASGVSFSIDSNGHVIEDVE